MSDSQESHFGVRKWNCECTGKLQLGLMGGKEKIVNLLVLERMLDNHVILVYREGFSQVGMICIF